MLVGPKGLCSVVHHWGRPGPGGYLGHHLAYGDIVSKMLSSNFIFLTSGHDPAPGVVKIAGTAGTALPGAGGGPVGECAALAVVFASASATFNASLLFFACLSYAAYAHTHTLHPYSKVY